MEFTKALFWLKREREREKERDKIVLTELKLIPKRIWVNSAHKMLINIFRDTLEVSKVKLRLIT